MDLFRSPEAYARNIEFEYRRNGERYSLLRWAQQAFEGLRVVPPGAGICHQVNLEHLGQVVSTRDGVAFPDTLVGTDSHTTMINGLGVLGWGVGGIEAEAAMLGQPMFLPQPVVIGVRMTGALPAGTTATDLVLTLTEMLRAHGVVGKFVEFFGDGLSSLSIADRATLSNMCPEYGATASYFPVDAETMRYLTFTGRGDRVDLAERYTKEQGMFRRDGDPEPTFSEILDLDLSSVVPSMAGPKRPQDRVALPGRVGLVPRGVPRSPRARPEGRRDRAVRGRGRVAAQRRAPRGRGRRGSSRGRERRGARQRRDRRDHLLHEHLEPVRDAGRRAAGAQGDRGRPGHQAVGEDLARARLARGHRLPRPSRAHAVPRQARVRAGGLRLHHLHRQLRAR